MSQSFPDGPMASDFSQEVQGLRKALERGNTEPDEFFCLTLSLLGHAQTREEFPKLVDGLQWSNFHLHTELLDIYTNYFQQPELPHLPASDYDQELDLALALSLHEADLTTQSLHPPIAQNTAARFGDNLKTSSPPSFASVVGSSFGEKDRETQSYVPNPERQSLNCGLQEGNYSEKAGGPASEKRDAIGFANAYQGQPEPEDCVLDCFENGGIFPVQALTDPKKVKHTRQGKKGRRKRTSALLRSPSARKPVVVWFRRDLRIHDNPALMSALELGAPVIPVFLWCFSEENGENFTLAAGGATRYWLHHALLQLNQSLLERYGSHIVFRTTLSCHQELASIVEEVGADTVIVNSVYEPWLKERDEHILKMLQKKGVNYRLCHSYCLYEPYSIRTEGVGLRGIGSVSHFMSCCQKNSPLPSGAPLEAPSALPIPCSWPTSTELQQLQLSRMPRRKDGTVIDWAATIRKTWDFSEDGAYKCLENFLSDGIRSYEKESGRADKPNTSHISPYLHFGQISPRTVLHEAHFTKKSVPKFLRKLAWRDLAYWLLLLFPEMPVEPVRPAYKDTLVDADVAINAMMWQNGGMSGLDHWNFVMHPVDAALTCDPCGSYVRKWCPELSGLPDEYVHKPWKCAPSQLRRAGVIFDQNYPNRIIIDLEERRDQSLRDVVDVRKKYSEYVDAVSGCDMVPIPDQLLAITLGRKDGVEDVVRNRKGNFLLPVITRKEFKYKTLDPDSKDNPYNTVLKGYVSRKRDETIAYMNERDFTASTINEGALRHERQERTSRIMQGLPEPKEPQNKSRRTPSKDTFTVVPPAFFHLAN
ncbi:uncharacterized protein [Ambystoma mexicanum]|uniref:uncharacterized protein isoform X2 n=1 Tax=Ambystoma mexicanum TaxID=8296 RepID=UPI0037E902A6